MLLLLLLTWWGRALEEMAIPYECLPESAKEKPMQGKVVATGPGKLLDSGERAKPTVKKGDTVVFGKYSGTEVEIKAVTHLIVRESELLGLIEK